MVDLNRVQVVWAESGGFTGANTFYQVGDVDLEIYKTFYDALEASIPSDVTISYPSSNLTYDSATGNVLSSWSATGQLDTIGTSGTDWARGVGAVLNWETTAFLNNRRVRGRSFLVPMEAASFDADGNVDPGFRSSVEGFAQTFIDDLDGALAVWHRPINSAGGQNYIVESCSVSGTPAILRSRRK